MSSKVATYWSTVGKKVFMALTGLAMVVFLVEHLSGNLLLLLPESSPYNAYAHFLISLGWLLVPAELVLLAIPICPHVGGDPGDSGQAPCSPRRLPFLQRVPVAPAERPWHPRP